MDLIKGLSAIPPAIWRFALGIRCLRPDDIRALGLLCGLLGIAAASITPFAAWEADLGLIWLFRLRGPRPPPPEVVLVSLDRDSAEALGLDPRRLHRWPRALHARLLNRLSRAGAELVVFDIHFHEARETRTDRQLASAMSRAANVVLFEHLEKSGDTLFSLEKRLKPLSRFAEIAVGSGPFTLAKGSRVQQFWLFKEGAGDAPSLPVVALHALLQRTLDEDDSELPSAAALKAHELAELLRAPQRREAWLAPHAHRRLAAAVMALHQAPGSRYLDFHGPPGSFPTLSYRQALDNPGDLDGRVVFVGYMEQPFETAQVDSFQTPFPGKAGVAASGVEIAATAFANLLEERFPTPPPAPWYLLLLLAWGLSTTVLYRLPALWAPPGAMLLATLYLGLATWLFRHWVLWLPVSTPLLIQLPAALLGALTLRYIERQRLQRHMSLFTHPELSHRVAGGESILDEATALFGVCLSSDASRFTGQAEVLAPPRLRERLNRYYGLLFPLVAHHGGRVSDVIGDEMLAVWDRPLPTPQLREQALDATLAMVAHLQAHTRGESPVAFPTRFGLHCGQIVVGSVGAGDHFEYRAVGDVVNTATRIQSLNKQLGTTVLASRAVVAELTGFEIRELGWFRLVGRGQPLEILEVRRRADTTDRNPSSPLLADFAVALRAFRNGALTEARERFAMLASQHEDGPSRFYRDYCESLPATVPADWSATVELHRK